MLTKQQVIRLEKMAELCQDGYLSILAASFAVGGNVSLHTAIWGWFPDVGELMSLTPDDRVMMILFYLEANRGEN